LHLGKKSKEEKRRREEKRKGYSVILESKLAYKIAMFSQTD